MAERIIGSPAGEGRRLIDMVMEGRHPVVVIEPKKPGDPRLVLHDGRPESCEIVAKLLGSGPQ